MNASTGQILNETRLAQLVRDGISFIASAEFTAGDGNVFLEEMPDAADYFARQRQMKPPANVQPGHHEPYRWPLLSPGQERHLFRQMNYLRYLAAEALNDCQNGDAGRCREVVALLDRADSVRDILYMANQRLGIHLVSKHASRPGCREQLSGELMSLANESLLKAIDFFDYSQGYKFSTYATWAIVHNLSSGHNREDAYQKRHAPLPLDEIQAVELTPETDLVNLTETLLDYLEPLEANVVRKHLGFSANGPQSLKILGQTYGVSRERIRQIYDHAVLRLQKIAQNLDLLEDSKAITV